VQKVLNSVQVSKSRTERISNVDIYYKAMNERINNETEFLCTALLDALETLEKIKEKDGSAFYREEDAMKLTNELAKECIERIGKL
jgi:hypothetical protein